MSHSWRATLVPITRGAQAFLGTVAAWTALAFLGADTTQGQTSVYVDAGATGPVHDGSSWCQAYTELHEALAVAGPEDTILVADGTYTPDTTGLSDLSEATFQLMIGLTLEGGYAGCGAPDPDDRDIDGYKTILSGDLDADDGPGFENNDENVYHVVTGSETDSTAILDGFTVSGGNADGPGGTGYNRGGGMYVAGGTPTLRACTFRANWALFGGGLGNAGANPTLINCTFIGNSAGGQGGGVENGPGSPTLINCVFSGNSAGSHGGGMRNDIASYPTLVNCTFSENVSVYGGGISCGFMDGANLTNCILWGNHDSEGSDEGAQVSCNSLGVNYTCIQGLTGDLGGTGNIGDDPLFLDADGPDDTPGTEDDNLRLQAGSPCIDAGDNVSVPSTVTTDRDGNGRIVDGDDDGTPTVDLGAYEFQGAGEPIPALSEWGLIVMTLLALTVGAMLLRRGWSTGHTP